MTKMADMDLKTILIVDDDPFSISISIVVDHLEGCGYQVTVAQGGEEALKQAEFVQPDLILLDVMMPGIDGFETCRRLKARATTASIPVIFMTALADVHDKVAAFTAGGVDYVSKPFQVEELLVRVETHLNLRTAQRRLAAQNLELQEIEQGLAFTNLLLKTQSEASLDGIVIVDQSKTIISFNRRFANLWDISPADLAAGKDEIILAKVVVGIKNPQVFMARVQHLYDHPGEDSRDELETIDGRFIDRYTVTLYSPSHAYLGRAWFFRDITERKQVEVELGRIQRLEATGNLIGGLAHDFNNYLATIIGNLDLLQDRVANDAETAEYVDTALSGALRCAELTKSLLAFARCQPLSPREMDIRDCVNEAALLIEHTLGKDILVETEVAPDLWPVRIDDVMLNTSLINLANNARDAMPRGGKLTIAARNVELDKTHASKNPEARAGDFVLIEVSDTGGGMMPEILAKAFEPFYTTKGPGHGTGLGLSMVHGFVKQSGGHIGIYSEAGHGTAVRIYLPRVTDAQAAASPSSTKPPMSPRGAETILLVDDNQAVRGTAARLVADLGYRVLEADGAEAAVDILTRGEPMIDLLFTDIVMPGDLDGYALARIVGERWPHIKVLLTSGFTGGRPDDKRMQVESLRVLTKPYRKDDLARAIRATLDLAPPPRPSAG